MARLGTDRGRELIVVQTNVDPPTRQVVAELDFIEGAYDPDHYEIVGYNEPSRVVRKDEAGNPVTHPEFDAVIMDTVYPAVPAAEQSRIKRAAADERKDARDEAKRLNPQGGTDPSAGEPTDDAE